MLRKTQSRSQSFGFGFQIGSLGFGTSLQDASFLIVVGAILKSDSLVGRIKNVFVGIGKIGWNGVVLKQRRHLPEIFGVGL